MAKSAASDGVREDPFAAGGNGGNFDTVEALWEQFIAARETPMRDKLILHYSPLVKYVAGRVSVGLPSNIDQQDLISYGIFGLIDAINKFDPGRGFKFETYAVNRIKGAIIDELRSIDWVPRSVRSKARQLEKAMGKLENELQRAPTDEEVANELDISNDDLQDIYSRLSFVSIAALDDVASGADDGGAQLSLVDTLADPNAEDPEASFEDQEMKAIIAHSIGKLSEREQKVVRLYYYEGLTLSQIGQVLGVTESRVSQMHTKAVLTLRSRVKEAIGVA
ncbi:MAG: RNA polymerase sigma factor WhiG [Actinomycetota bacterium]